MAAQNTFPKRVYITFLHRSEVGGESYFNNFGRNCILVYKAVGMILFGL